MSMQGGIAFFFVLTLRLVTGTVMCLQPGCVNVKPVQHLLFVQPAVTLQ